MTREVFRRGGALLGFLILLGMAALAQDPAGDDGPGDNGFIVDFLQNRISAPGRQIRLEGVSGALSSQARIAVLTVSDERGVWLQLEGVEIDWSRRQLLLRRISINRLSVERIAFLRRPVAPEPALADRLPQIEAQPFSLPELPVAVRIAALELPRIELEPAALGQAATLSATGSADLARGELDAALGVLRTDGAGGELNLALDFSNATRELALNLRLQEPQGGVVATLLDIENRPAIDLTLAGAGPLDALDVDFAFDAGGARIAGGKVALRGAPLGLAFAANFRGGLAPFVPGPYRDFFAGETAVELAGVNLAAGGLRLDRIALRGAALELTGALETAADGFPRDLTLAGRLGDPRGPAITLPVPGASTSIHSAVLHLAYGAGRRWSGLVALDRLTAGDIEVEDLTLTLGGLAENLDTPDARNLTIEAEGVATGVWSENPDIAAVLGTRLDLFADAALPPGGPLTIRQAQVGGNGVALFAAGDLAGLDFDGRIAARLADLAPASGLAGRDLGGALDLRLIGSINALSGGFDLALDGSAEGLRLGDPRLDGLLDGATTLGGRVARDAGGFRTDGFRLANPQVEITSSGRLTQGVTDLGIDVALTDLASLDPRLSGALTATGRATGEGRPIELSFEAAVPEGRLLDRELTGARLDFAGEVDGTDLRGAINGGAELDDQPVALSAEIELDGARRTLRDLSAVVGPNELTGEISQDVGAPILGRLALTAPDVAPLAALALTEASGALDATIDFAAAEVGQGVTVRATARDLVAVGNAIGALDLDARVVDALNAPLIDGDLSARDLRVAGLEIASLTAGADQTDATTMQISSQARLAIGTEAELSGAFSRIPSGFAATLQTLSLRQQGVAARLVSPATITVAEGAVRLTPLALDLGTGRLTAEGTIAESFDVSVAIQSLPLALANAVQPALGLAGTIDGAARITGPRAAPDASFDVRGEGIASTATTAAGLPALRLTASGRTADQRLRLNADLAAAGLDARATGSAPLGGPGALSLDVDLAAFPLPVLDRVAGDRGLEGTLTGQARVRGTLAAPAVEFDLRGAGISARPLRDIELEPLDVAAAGGFARNVLTLRSAEASNGQGPAITASGRAPLAGAGLDMRASGSLPLTVANALLAERSAQATGLVRFDLRAQGALAAPRLGGSATLAGGTFTDPLTNIRLQDIALDAGFEGQQANLRSFRAAVPQGGAITVSGTVSLAAGNPADLGVQFDQVRYTDGSFVATTIDGQLRLRGPATGGGGVVSGEIDLGRTEISVAEGLGGNAQAVLNEVEHIRTPPGVEETLRRARVGEPRTPQTAGRGGLVTDIRINAPNQIFVRGRGLDVELGGSLRLTGPTNDLAPVGQFSLRRGRLEVLGQRIEFEQGSLQLVGNLDPQVNLVARTRSGDVTAIITVAGRVSSPEITFSSEPPLPQDEVLAQVIFGRSVSNLSPFQIAQLASAAADLAGGGGGGGILGQLRSATGLDDLDIITDEEGETAVRAGRYIDDNIYLDVQAEAGGDTSAAINLDITDELTVRGSVASDGNSTLGVFFERDY